MDSTKFLAWWGAFFSTVGIGVSIHNYLWQREIQEERILVHLDASVTESPVPKCDLVMEVVNAGLRPLFIERAYMRIAGEAFLFYEHDPAKTSEPMKSLEPSEAIRYRIKDFTKLKFTVLRQTEPNGEELATVEWAEAPELQNVEIVVQTTKKTFYILPDSVKIDLVATLPQDRKSTTKQASHDH